MSAIGDAARRIPPARSLVIQLQLGVERLWCGDCNRQSRVRVYAISAQSIGVIMTICPPCLADKHRETDDATS